MFDKGKKLAEAKRFNAQGDAYIHAEMKNGKDCQIVLSGDGLAILHALGGVIDRVSTLTNASFRCTIETIAEMHDKTTKEE